MKLIGRFLAWLVVAGMSLAIVGGIFLVIVMYHFSRDLPDYKQLAKYDPPNVTRLYAADGKLLAEYATQKRIFVPLTAIPKRVINAFLAAEDKNFYEHPGVDIYGLLRAIHTNIQNIGGGGSMVGGSTITQQVVKNFLLDNRKSMERKVKEAILSFRITQVYSKDRILELYLNEIYLGSNSYGVAASALNYFNKSLDELSIEEVAFLAALPKAPNNYNPLKHYDRAIERRDYVLGRMFEDGYISAEEEKEAKAKPITLRQRDAEETTRADFFAEEVRRTLKEMYGDDILYKGGLVVKTTLNPELQKYADDALRKALVDYDRRHGYRGPVVNLAPLTHWQDQLREYIPSSTVYLTGGEELAVVTGLTPNYAEIGVADGKTGKITLEELKWARRDMGELKLGAEVSKPADVLYTGDVVIVRPVDYEAQEVEKTDPKDPKSVLPPKAAKDEYQLRQVPAVNGALVAMDPHTGRVLALSGGYSYGGTEFNRATQAKRQPGSSIKPFVYLAGMEAGFTPATIVIDAPVEMSQGEGLPMWRPQNYKDDYLGPATLRVGLEKSRNAMTVRLAQMVGLPHILRVLERFKIYDVVPRNFSIVLGASETTLLKMTNAYSMLVGGGKRVQPTLIERIDDRNGKIIYRRDMRECNGCIVDPKQLVTDMLPPTINDSREVVVDPRVAYQMTSMLQGVVERGTATKAKVIGKPLGGKTGTTNDSLDTWFVGFSPDLVAGVFVGFDKPQSLGKRETGGSVALPGFVEFMKHALADKPSTPFRIPPGIQLARVNLHTGQPPELDDDPKSTILESFVTGGAVYIPPVLDKDGKPVMQEEIIAGEEGISEGMMPEDMGWQPGGEEGSYPVINRNPAPSGGINPGGGQNAPEMGTGGLY